MTTSQPSMTAADVEHTLALFESSAPELKRHLAEQIKPECVKYADSGLPKTSDAMNRVCCEIIGGGFCPFYKQTWFLLAGAGIGILLCVLTIILCFYCIRKKNEDDGGNEETVEAGENAGASTKNDDE